MDKYEVPSQEPALRNFIVPIPGADVRVYLGMFEDAPRRWLYSLWTGEGDAELIETGALDFTGFMDLYLTPYKVAQVAFILYGDTEEPEGSENV